MRKLDENKLAKLHTAGELLDNKYGEVGTDSRTAFHEKSIAWYYGEILRDRRKELKITQQESAERIEGLIVVILLYSPLFFREFL